MKLLSNLQLYLILASFHLIQSQTIQESCITSSLGNLNARIFFDTSSLSCSNVWSSEGFILRYTQAGPSLWSFVLSAPNTNSYVAIGFSPNGGMVGSSAVVGWLAGDNTAAMRRYYLGGKTPSLVVPDQGNLQIMPNTSSILSFSSRMYLAFQLIAVLPNRQLIFAVGSSNNQAPTSSSFRLSAHRNQITVSFNYASGQGSQVNAPNSDLKRVHGILNAVGWGILLPIGAMIARYLKHVGRLWFYGHSCIQLLGFILGLSGIITGLILNGQIDYNVDKHKALGIIIVTLGCLQVSPLFVLLPTHLSIWTVLDWIGLDWTVLDWTELDNEDEKYIHIFLHKREDQE